MVDRDYVKRYIRHFFYKIAGLRDCELFVNALIDDVIEDIQEIADEELWNDCDIDIALTRVLKERLNIED